ncbi:MAG: glycosyltransferase, partial [Clostridia bacterium]|nr:glycosyltransferase [Clostridia bacterium]
METVQWMLNVIYNILSIFLMIMMVYQIYLTIFGFTRRTKDYRDHDPKSRFLVLVPAHNEEKVIAGIIENLQHMEYPKELYDFFIIADNCTDRTADVARQMGASVIETHRACQEEPTGKPIALRKALEQIGNYHEKYDLMMIFDADNLMDPNMFLEVNSQYLDKGKPELIQCYLGAKNQRGFVPWFYYSSYTSTNRFLQLAKYRLGLNCSVGGTGFAISTEYLYQRGGWTAMSLTEDFEIQVEATVEGRRVLWNHNVRIYDEKPRTMAASIRQRTRWAQGHFFVCFRNTGKVLSAMVHRRISIKEGISTLTYMYSLMPYLAATIQLLINGFFWISKLSQGAASGAAIGDLIMGLAGLTVGFMPLYYIA